MSRKLRTLAFLVATFALLFSAADADAGHRRNRCGGHNRHYGNCHNRHCHTSYRYGHGRNHQGGHCNQRYQNYCNDGRGYASRGYSRMYYGNCETVSYSTNHNHISPANHLVPQAEVVDQPAPQPGL